MSLSRLKDNLLHINNLRKFFSYEIFKLAIGSETKQKLLENPPKGRVLVLSPHPDDDIIGCGGVLKLHREQGDEVKIVYLTSNEKREKEAKSAAEKLSIDDLVFWRYQDNQITAKKTTVELLKSIFSNFKPDLIYIPSFLDPNPDHFETCKILFETLKHHPEPTKSSQVKSKDPHLVSESLQIYSTEVWSPIYANRLVAIDKTVEAKKKALEEHTSQVKDRNYLDATVGLAQYRAGMFNAGKYAEAFFACNKDLYLKLFELILNPNGLK